MKQTYYNTERSRTYTVESVTSGHPDKICDQVSDAILDACLTQDPKSRVAMETFGSHGLFVIGGEVTTRAKFNAEGIARRVYRDIGYTDKLKIVQNIIKQSPDIAMGVDTGGAGDQGIMYGYATNETKEYMPYAVVLVHALTSGLEKLRKSKKVKWLLPDGKAQVTIHNGKIETILVSAQHKKNVSQEEIKEILTKKLIKPLVGDVASINILVNPTGKFFVGGFVADTGLTGRKIMVDTYGGLIAHGGGCFSGKDPTKVDRSGAYATRFIAKNIVAKGMARRCEMQIAYVIGKPDPVSKSIETFGTEKVALSKIESFANELIDLSVLGIIQRLDLRRPIYKETATYGHFGNPKHAWERIV